jgi:thiamine-monophosphate kinase
MFRSVTERNVMTEFELIERYFSPLGDSTKSELFLQGNGDDCAVMHLPPGASLCFSIDTQVEGVHFPAGAPAERIAYRALACAMSDLAAMGAHPAFFTLALTLPRLDEVWLEMFASGLKVLVDTYQFPLVGGDTTKGPLTISVQVHGLLEKAPLLRSGACAGDIVAVSGTLGDAGGALGLLEKFKTNQEKLSADEHFLLNRYFSPSPRIELGQSLLDLASSCIDISDGLLAEAGHIARASGVALHLESESVPLSPALSRLTGAQSAQQLAMTSGDDYELLFTMPPENWDSLMCLSPELPLSRVGSVKAGEGVFLDGELIAVEKKGYLHFA